MNTQRSWFMPFAITVILLLCSLGWLTMEHGARKLAQTQKERAEQDLKFAHEDTKERVESIRDVVIAHMIEEYAAEEVRECKKLRSPQDENCVIGAKASQQHFAQKLWDDMLRRASTIQYNKNRNGR